MNSVYDVVFKDIISKLESGVSPWSKPWNGGPVKQAMNPITGTIYSGSNAGLLFCDQLTNGRGSEKYATFKQWAEKGRFVKKGEKAIPVVFWGKAQDKTDEDKQFMFIKYYSVFNESQLSDFAAPDLKQIDFDPIESTEKLIQNSPLTSLRIVHEKQRAFYSPNLDYINMPKPASFVSNDAYYATLFHEIGHATGHADRLARDMSGMFGNHAYSREELIAELTSAFLCAESGIKNQVEQNAAYCKAWLQSFKDHPKEMLQAFSQAAKATDYFLNRKRDAFKEREAA